MDEILGRIKGYKEKINRLQTLFLTHMGATYKGHYYFTTDSFGSEVHKMQNQCQEKGGYLVEINDEEEYKFVESYLKRLSAHSPFSSRDYFIGLKYDGHKGRWTYMTSGGDVTFFKWATSNPVPGLRCAFWRRLSSVHKGWVNYFCELKADSYFMGICEVDLSYFYNDNKRETSSNVTFAA